MATSTSRSSSQCRHSGRARRGVGEQQQRQRRRSTAAASQNHQRASRDRSIRLLAVATAAAISGGGCGVHAGWVDPDTPMDKRTTTSLVDGTEYKLVMSDEFNVPGRTFADGHDKTWTALDKPDDDFSASGGGSLHFYNSTTVTTTKDGMLKISSLVDPTEWTRFDPVQKEYKKEVKYYKSGMVQSWDKFCFTGGIVDVDVIMPGDPFIGGLWPAIWILGNLGRSTYEASTNRIWPWSYNTCNRKKQDAQKLSACNKVNHYGLHPGQGRGATEIDIIEGMMGDSNGPLPGTKPNVSLPYVDMTLQVAPGIPENRPQTGHPPLKEDILTAKGQTQFAAQTWYEGLEFYGNTSLNPFFYGTWLGETAKNEPVQRTKKQAFQADAVGAMHQLVPAHFKKVHTFRIEWQPGPGGRLDWYTKAYKIDANNSKEGDGKGTEWVKAFTLKDASIKDLMGSQIPNEPSYLILNTAISSTWGFPYDVPEWCEKCYDCNNATCACAFNPGFCNMMKSGTVAMYVDNIRVYQSDNDDAHVGNTHTLGCDPPEYPTREYIKGHEYLYMRQAPFVYDDKHALKKVVKGGGACETDADCGCDIAIGGDSGGGGGVDGTTGNSSQTSRRRTMAEADVSARGLSEVSGGRCPGRGQCVSAGYFGLFAPSHSKTVCQCNEGYTGPMCLSIDHIDEAPSAYEIRNRLTAFEEIPSVLFSPFTLALVLCFLVAFLISLVAVFMNKRKTAEEIMHPAQSPKLKGPHVRTDGGENEPLIPGRQVV